MTTGAGGLSIRPALKIQIPVSEGSSAHTCILEFLDDVLYPDKWEKAFLRLQNQFSDQKLHPGCVISGKSGAESLLDVCVLYFA